MSTQCRLNNIISYVSDFRALIPRKKKKIDEIEVVFEVEHNLDLIYFCFVIAVKKKKKKKKKKNIKKKKGDKNYI